METLNICKNARKNPKSTIALVLFGCFVMYLYVENIWDIRQAATNYDYCKGVCDLFVLSFKTVTWGTYFIVSYLTYINKQFSKWSLRLFYVVAVAFLVYYIAAGNLFEYLLNHLGAEHIDKLPSLARGIFGAPAYFTIFSFFFLPKLIKDVIKLKQEQELIV